MGGERVERVSPANSGSSSKLRRFGSILALSGRNETDFSRIAYLDPNPELEKHPMSLEASQSSRESTRYPRDIKPGAGGTPRKGFGVSRKPSGFSRRLRGFEAHRMLEEPRIRILGYSNASNPFLVHHKIENPKMLRMKFWTSEIDVKKWSK